MHTIKMVQVFDGKLIKEVKNLAYEIWTEHYIPIIGAAQVSYMLEKFQSERSITNQIDQGYLYFLIQYDSKYIGYIGAIQKGEELFLSKIYLKSDKRGKGCGRQAIKFVEELAKERYCSKITLTVNKNNANSIKAYEKIGFINAGSVVQDIGNGFFMDDYKMEKNI